MPWLGFEPQIFGLPIEYRGSPILKIGEPRVKALTTLHSFHLLPFWQWGANQKTSHVFAWIWPNCDRWLVNHCAMPSIGQTWVLVSIGAVVWMGILSTLKRLLMESNSRHVICFSLHNKKVRGTGIVSFIPTATVLSTGRTSRPNPQYFNCIKTTALTIDRIVSLDHLHK
jgi:hypothetical protein